MKTVQVSIRGISPLLMNKPNAAEIADKAKERLAGENRLARQYEDKQYRNGDGELYIPSIAMRNAIIESGKKIKVKGQGKATYSKIFGYSIFFPKGEIIHKLTDLEPFDIIAVNPNTKGRNMLRRPMLREWEATFEIEYDDEEIPAEVLKLALDNAGRRVGVGDWRPQKKGMYGRFIVTEFKEVKA